MGILKDMAVLRVWLQHTRQLEEFRASALKLLVHPDATQEQRETVIEKVQNIERLHTEARNKMWEKGYRV